MSILISTAKRPPCPVILLHRSNSAPTAMLPRRSSQITSTTRVARQVAVGSQFGRSLGLPLARLLQKGAV